LQDVFYTDLRDPSATDLTKPILDWLRNSKEEAQKKWEYIINGELQHKQKAVVGEASVSHLPRFASVEMHKIYFCDLSFRLGAGYLYCHQVLSFICHGLIVLLLPLHFSFFKNLF
jgi:snRNA-activating protein complex subunit 3